MLLIRSLIIAACLTAATSAHADDDGGASSKTKQVIDLDGQPERVNWGDGDTFTVMEGARKGFKARLKGYNTLESYGPVHFWGEGHGWDFHRVHKAATAVARGSKWKCRTEDSGGGYGRALVSCPDLQEKLITDGLAHVYAFKEEADPKLLALQHKAQAGKRGMWKFGVPAGLVTSVHSVDEKKGGDGDGDSYHRVTDTKTGQTWTVTHSAVYRPCDVFCEAGSCMVYIPFDARYGDRKARCMKGEEGEKNRMHGTSGPPHLDAPVPPSKP
jgi:micrococcal nuclease